MARHYSETRKNLYRLSETKRREITERKKNGRRMKAETLRRFA